MGWIKKWMLTGIGFCLSLFLQAQSHSLDFYITEGMKNSPLLNDFSNRIRSSRIDSLRLMASRGLQVNGKSASYFAPVVKGWGYDEVITNGANLNAVVELSKEFTGMENLKEQLRTIELQKSSAEVEGRLSQSELQKNITAQYLDAWGAQQQYALDKQVLVFLLESDTILRKLTSEGMYRQTQYLSLVASRQQQELTVMQSRNRCMNALGILNYLCGIYDSTWVQLTGPEMAPSTSIDPQSSLYYESFIVDSLKLDNQDRLIDFSYRPKISAFVDGGYSSSLIAAPYKNFGFSGGLNLTVPIYDGKQKKMQHNQLIIARETQNGYSSFFTSQYKQQVQMLYRQLQNNVEISQRAEKQLKYMETLVDAYRKLMNTGEVTVTDYLLSISNYMNAGTMLMENRMEAFRIINELNYWNRSK